MKKLDIAPSHLQFIQKILQDTLPAEATVWVFGSRATGAAKKYSDLDLAININKPLSLETLAEIYTAFAESSLPYKVDIVDWTAISKDFQEKINEDKIFLWPNKKELQR